MRLGRVLLAIVALCAGAPAYAQGFPEFPVRYEERYPQDEAGLRRRSESGDGYATLALAERLQCNSAACEARRNQLYRRAAEQNETMAPALQRVRAVRADASEASRRQIGSSVCGRTAADVEAILVGIRGLEFPVRNGQQGWRGGEGVGDRGARMVAVARGPVSASFILSGERLVIVRLMINVLEVGPSESDGESVLQTTGAIAEAVCPNWTGLREAVRDYGWSALRTWPPRGIHVDGPSTWFAVMGVTPDILWYDLYVDPRHNPFTSGMEERFQVAERTAE